MGDRARSARRQNKVERSYKRLNKLFDSDFCDSLDCPETPDAPESETSTCMSCLKDYNNKDVMIVEDVGPMCMICLHNAAYLLLGR